jgi:hypothetical protein
MQKHKEVKMMPGFIQRKSVLARNILIHFNNAFQSVIQQYGHNKLNNCIKSPSSDIKSNFKRQFSRLADDINLVCQQIQTLNKQINPCPYIRRVSDLVHCFDHYPRSSQRFFCQIIHGNNRFRHLFQRTVIDYYNDLLQMIRYTCDDFDPDVPLLEVEVHALLNYFTNNSMGSYRDLVLGNSQLEVTFQRRETTLSRNDTITHLGELKPLIACN